MPRQRWLRIIPAALITYTIAYIDRTNISMALPAMSRGLQMNATQAGNVAGIFYWGYILLQVPGGHLANRWSAKRFIAILLAAWGVAAVGCGLARTWQELWVMRLALGLTQGGVWSAMLVLVSHWFPRRERARANAFWMVCAPLALIIASPLSGWILDRWNWRVMLMSEGALPFLWLAIWLATVYDYPRQARWISADERGYLESTLEGEVAQLEPVKPESILLALVRPQVLLLVLIFFIRSIAELGFLFWLPSALKAAEALSNATVGLVTTIPFIVGIVSMLLNSSHSDKTGERRGHISLAFGLGGLFLLVGVLLSRQSPVPAFVLVCLTAVGLYGAQGPFWSIPTETLPRNVAGPAMGLVTGVGSLGGFFGPLLVGYFNKHTGGFAYGFGLIAVDLLIGAALTFLLNRAPAEIRQQVAA